MTETDDAGKKVRVIGCGNPMMGNDGVGLAVLEALAVLDPGIELVEGGTGGLGLVPLIEGYDLVVIVDAVVGMGEPGQVIVFDSPPADEHVPRALHEFGVAEAIAFASAIGLPAEVLVVGIEVGEVKDFSDSMDTAVGEAVMPAAETILREIKERMR
jgi:hydrogenase maturation protease